MRHSKFEALLNIIPLKETGITSIVRQTGLAHFLCSTDSRNTTQKITAAITVRKQNNKQPTQFQTNEFGSITLRFSVFHEAFL
jgi:hypothetical protein